MSKSGTDRQSDLPLRVSEWDFTRLPESELIAGCLWEYARESPSIGARANRQKLSVDGITGIKTWRGEPIDEAEFDRRDKQLRAEEQAIGYDAEEFAGRFLGSDVGWVYFYRTLTRYVTPSINPWQDLPKRLRRTMVKQLGERTLMQPLAESMVADLEKLWDANSAALKAVRERVRPPDDDTEDGELYTPSSPVRLPEDNRRAASRTTAVAFTVDFSRFSNREISAEFERWLAANRPSRWRRPSNLFPVLARGRKENDYRVALERLAIMRLLHWTTPRSLRFEQSRAWRLYGAKEPTFRREIQGCLRFFHQSFPFLPKSERPRSFERNGVWLRRYQHVPEEVLEDMKSGLI